MDTDGSHHTILKKYMRKFIKFSDSADWRFLTEADQEIRDGHILVCVPTPTDEEKNLVIGAFQRSGAYDIRYFGPIAVEEVI